MNHLLKSRRKMEKSTQMNDKIGIPRTLIFQDYFPMWSSFLRGIGKEIITSDRTNKEIIEEGLSSAGLDICFPVKVALGHIKNLEKKGVKKIFFPTIIEYCPDKNSKNEFSFNCPYIQAFGSFLQYFGSCEIISPSFPFMSDRKFWAKRMRELAGHFEFRGGNLEAVIKNCFNVQDEFKRLRHEKGKQFIESGRKGIVIFARNYCIGDSSINIPEIFCNNGIDVVPYDFLSFSNQGDISSVWNFGNEYIQAAETIKENPNLYPVTVSFFGCGPDSFFLSKLEGILKNKLHLKIDLDEHFSDEGIKTRVEAFLDSIKNSNNKHQSSVGNSRLKAGRLHESSRVLSKKRDNFKKVFIPHVADHYLSFYYSLSKAGVDAEMLPPPDKESERLGREYTTGKECYPFILFAGDFAKLTKRKDFDSVNSSFLILGNGSSCRAGEFGDRLRDIAIQMRSNLSVFNPMINAKANQLVEKFGYRTTENIWKGWVAVDYLHKLLYEVRPFEQTKGDAERVYNESILHVLKNIGEKSFILELKKARDRLSDIAPVEKRTGRALIGLIGEHYMQYSSYANNNLVENIEKLGGVVFVPCYFNDFVMFSIHRKFERQAKKLRISAVPAFLERHFQFKHENKIASLFNGFLINHPEPSLEKSIEYASKYISPDIEPVAFLNVSKAVDFAEKKVNGLANVMPLGCLLNYIPTMGAYSSICKKHNIPRVDLRFDGLQYTNQRTRIEAFMDLAWQNFYEKGHNRDSYSAKSKV